MTTATTTRTTIPIRELTPTEKREQAERAACPACQDKRIHTEEEWKQHPGRGTGIVHITETNA